MKEGYTIHWFQRDLRIYDNPALSLASRTSHKVIGLYISEEEKNKAQYSWLHLSLHALQTSLRELHIPLIIMQGPTLEAWEKLLQQLQICHVTWNRLYEPQLIKSQQRIQKLLLKHGIPVETTEGYLLLEPSRLSTSSGNFYKVFTPYWNMHQKVYTPLSAAAQVKPNTSSPVISTLKIEDLNLLKKSPLSLQEIEKRWCPGEQGAERRLKHFIKNELSYYDKGRNFPAQPYHSSLSPHLHFGEISPHTVARALESCSPSIHTKSFLRELVFRDFAAQLLYHIPSLPEDPMKSQFSRWKWDNKPAYFEAWKRGETGYPIVDAGMRQMYYTGFMHNRVRMIVASFLVKDLNIAWQKGAEWFFERLLDADLANNSFNWQWSAGTGPDAQPFFRIFNPELQSAKFDPQGLYIRHWVPELEKAPTSVLHAPWKAKPAELAAGSIVLGKTYPHVIVDHDVMKKKALEEFHRVGL